MAFVTNQFLKGCYVRRGHYPVGVKMSVITRKSEWSKNNKVVAQLKLSASTKGNQHVYFTKKDIADILPPLAELTDKKTIEKISISHTKNLSDGEFLEYLSMLIQVRKKKVAK